MAYEEQCAGKRWPCGEEQEDREAAHGAAAEEWERGTVGRAKEAVRRAMRLLMSRDRSERELLERLGREGFGPEETGTALEYVKSYGYVNDRRYAENYVMSAGGKKSRAATESTITISTAPERTMVSVISSACSPLSGWEMYRLSISTPIFLA